MAQCVVSAGTWTEAPATTKLSLTAHWLPRYPSGEAAGEPRAGTHCAGMNVRGPAQHALRTSWRCTRALASVDPWPLAWEAPLPPAMPMWHLIASSRAAFWTSAWAMGPMTYFARLWLPMLLHVRPLALSSRTGGRKLAVVSVGRKEGLCGKDLVSVGLVWFHPSVSGSFCFFLSVCLCFCLLVFSSVSPYDCLFLIISFLVCESLFLSVSVSCSVFLALCLSLCLSLSLSPPTSSSDPTL